jgi:hypothetical protein
LDVYSATCSSLKLESEGNHDAPRTYISQIPSQSVLLIILNVCLTKKKPILVIV